MIITLQIVNYNSREYLRTCLDSIEKSSFPKKDLQIIIINNEAESLVAGSVRHGANLAVEIVEAGKNLGFGKAHNLGFERAKGDYILFLNPDTRISENTIIELVEIFENNIEAGIAGPLLVDENGATGDEHCGSKKTPFSIIKAKITGGKFPNLNDVVEVDWLSGGAMMVRKDLFAELGGFDENYFMYYEDVDFCLRARNRNLKVIVNPRAKVLHAGGKSFTGSKEKKRHYYSSQDYYLQKNFGLIPALVAKIMRFPLYFKNVYFEQ
jgi:GT2 family glycosyltransferase